MRTMFVFKNDSGEYIAKDFSDRDEAKAYALENDLELHNPINPLKPFNKRGIVSPLGDEKMPVPEAQKQRQAKWDSENMKIVAAKIKKGKAEEFQKLCALNGETMNEVLQRAIDEYIEQHRPMIP